MESQRGVWDWAGDLDVWVFTVAGRIAGGVEPVRDGDGRTVGWQPVGVDGNLAGRAASTLSVAQRALEGAVRASLYPAGVIGKCPGNPWLQPWGGKGVQALR